MQAKLFSFWRTYVIMRTFVLYGSQSINTTIHPSLFTRRKDSKRSVRKLPILGMVLLWMTTSWRKPYLRSGFSKLIINHTDNKKLSLRICMKVTFVIFFRVIHPTLSGNRNQCFQFIEHDFLMFNGLVDNDIRIKRPCVNLWN